MKCKMYEMIFFLILDIILRANQYTYRKEFWREMSQKVSDSLVVTDIVQSILTKLTGGAELGGKEDLWKM